MSEKLYYATYDLKFLLDRGYKKKNALNFVSNRYLLDLQQRNFLARTVFSSEKSETRKKKIIDINEIKNQNLIVDGYNVLITVESICLDDQKSIVFCDDGVLRDLNAVFGKYKYNEMTEKALNIIISFINKYKPKNVIFFFDRQVSFSGELSKYTRYLLNRYKIKGKVVISKIVDFNLIKSAKEYNAIVATSDSIIIDEVDKIVDLPYNISNSIKSVIRKEEN
jgi:hypothetical protein